MNIIGAVSVVGMGAEDGNSCKSGSRKMEGVEGGGYRAGEVEVQAATGNNSVHAVGGTSLDEEAGRTASSQVVRPEGFWSVFFSSIAKIGSAGLYLSDYVSNILVMREYYILYRTDSFGGVSNVVIGIEPFLICLAFIILDPIVTAIIFKLKLPAREHPLRSAFFLPLVQLKRFIQGFFKTGSCAGANKVLESDETEALFAAAVAIETGPQTMLQFTVIALVGTNLDYRSLLQHWSRCDVQVEQAVEFRTECSWNRWRSFDIWCSFIEVHNGGFNNSYQFIAA
uniref:Uncharacterized protein n=1 Tax=Physcomitrium patens TaxID=3218 RepID=A0A7I4BUT9_PHYPA